MAETTTLDDGSKLIEFSSGRKLAHASGVEVFSNREALRDFLNASADFDQHLPSLNRAINFGNIEISLVWYKKASGRAYYKVSYGKKDYFVKRVPTKEKPEFGGGTGEYLATEEAKKILGDLPWVEVIDYQLAYDNSSYNYFVSKWNEDAELWLKDYIRDLEHATEIVREGHDVKLKELEELKEKLHILEERLLPKFHDFRDYNIGYNPKTKKMVLYDLNLEKPETIGAQTK